MNKTLLIVIGIASFVSGLVIGNFLFPAQTNVNRENLQPVPLATDQVPDAPAVIEIDRPEEPIKIHDQQLRLELSRIMNDIPIAIREKIEPRINPLLKAFADLGIGEHGASSLGFLVMSEAAREDPDGVFKHLLDRGSTVMRSFQFLAVFTQWIQTDIEAALSAVSKAPIGIRNDLRSLLLQAMQTENPARAYEFANSEMGNSIHYYSIFKEWAKTDLETAKAHINEIADERLRYQAFSAIVTAQGDRRPEATWEWASGFEGEMRHQAMSRAFGPLMENDFVAALDALEGIMEYEVQRRILVDNITEITNRDPEVAYNLATGSLSGRDLYHAALKIVEADLTDAGLATMQRMIETHPPGEYRDHLAGEFALKWAASDPEATHNWLSKSGDLAAIPDELRARLAERHEVASIPATAIDWGALGD